MHDFFLLTVTFIAFTGHIDKMYIAYLPSMIVFELFAVSKMGIHVYQLLK